MLSTYINRSICFSRQMMNGKHQITMSYTSDFLVIGTGIAGLCHSNTVARVVRAETLVQTRMDYWSFWDLYYCLLMNGSLWLNEWWCGTCCLTDHRWMNGHRPCSCFLSGSSQKGSRLMETWIMPYDR